MTTSKQADRTGAGRATSMKARPNATWRTRTARLLAILAMTATVMSGAASAGIARADGITGGDGAAQSQTAQPQGAQSQGMHETEPQPHGGYGEEGRDGNDAQPPDGGASTGTGEIRNGEDGPPSGTDTDDAANTTNGNATGNATDTNDAGDGTSGDGASTKDTQADAAHGDDGSETHMATDDAQSDDAEPDTGATARNGDWRTNGITLVHDGLRHRVDVAGDGGTDLTGMTVELRAIGLTQEDGIVHAVSEEAADAARAAGGGGDHPADDLLRRIVAGTLHTDTTAPTLLDGLASATPDATREGAGSLTVDAGLYVVSLAPGDGRTQAQLVYAGDSNRRTAMMMLSGQAKLAGTPRGEATDPAEGNGSSLPQRAWDGLTSLFSIAREPVPNTLDYGPITGGVGRNAYNYDFTWHTEENGSPAAFCVNPGVPQPMRGSTYSRKDIIDDNRIRTVLWYGYRGFNSIYDPHNEGTWGRHAGGSVEQQAWATHMLVSAYWMGRDPRSPNWHGPYGANDTWSISNEEIMALPGYQDLLWLVENRPLSPNVDFYAWRLYVAIGTKLGENGTAGEVRNQWDQENAAQAMVSGVFKPTRIEVSTAIRDMGAINRDRTRPLGDDITITPRATKGTSDASAGWPAGEQLLVCSRLSFNANDGGETKGPKEKCTIANPSEDVPGGVPYKLPGHNADELTFRPADFPEATVGGKGVAWAAGHFWFDVYFDSRHVLDQPAYTGENKKFYSHVFNFAWDRGWWLYTNFIYDDKGAIVGEEPGENITLHDFATAKGGRGVDPDGHAAPVTDTVITTAGGGSPQGQWARTWLYVDTRGGDTADMVCGADGREQGFGTRWELHFTDGRTTSPQFTPAQCRMMDGQLPLVDGFGAFAGTGDTRGELTEWPGGHYWYDTKIALADHLGGEYWHRGLETGDDSESWSRRRLLRAQWAPTAVKSFDAGHSRTDVTAFRATLYDADADGNPTSKRQTVAFDADGTATFTPIDYREDALDGKDSRTFVYALREEAFDGPDLGVAFDERTHVIEVTLRKEGDDRLTATASSTQAPTFANVYRPDPATVEPTAVKTFTGDGLAKADITGFRFELIDGDGPDGTVLETRSVDADTVRESGAPGAGADGGDGDDGDGTTGTVRFSPIVYCAPTDDVTEGCPPQPRADPVGRHVYTVREVARDGDGVDYDETLHRFVVDVTDDGMGHLSATLSTPDAKDGMGFVNSYRPSDVAVTLEARKAYREAGGRDLAVDDGQFVFDLFAGDAGNGDGKPIATVSTTGDGTVRFRGGDGDGEIRALRFTAEDMAGKQTIERRFSIVEREGDDPHITYDTRPRVVTITVEDDGIGHLTATAAYDGGPTAPTVTNIRHTPTALPVTGGFDLVSAGVLALIALLLAILGLRAMATSWRPRIHGRGAADSGTPWHAA